MAQVDDSHVGTVYCGTVFGYIYILVDLLGVKPPWSLLTRIATTVFKRFANILARILTSPMIREIGRYDLHLSVSLQGFSRTMIRASRIVGGRTQMSKALF